jgi:hypothetical protein
MTTITIIKTTRRRRLTNDPNHDIAQILGLIEILQILLKQQQIIIGPGQTGRQRGMFEFNARKNLQHSIQDQVLFLLVNIADLQELFVPKVNERLILMIASVTTVDPLVFVIEEGELHFGVDVLGIFGNVLDKEGYVAVGGRVAQTLRIQVEDPARIFVSEYGRGQQRIDFLFVGVKVGRELFHAPNVIN